MGRTDDGGLGWPPAEFWRATAFDMERAQAFAIRRSGAITKDEARDLEMNLRDHRQREAEERAAGGDTRSHREIMQEMTARILAQGKAD